MCRRPAPAPSRTRASDLPPRFHPPTLCRRSTQQTQRRCEAHLRNEPEPGSGVEGRLTDKFGGAKRRAGLYGALMRAFLFPGQGSQAVGMGAALAGASRPARDVFDEVDEALGQNLFRLMCDGPDDELKLTENAQPAIMANSIAVFRTMGVALADVANFVAGHSLGEYSALCAAGSFDLSTTAKLLKLRG